MMRTNQPHNFSGGVFCGARTVSFFCSSCCPLRFAGGELARWRVAVLELRNRAGLTNDEADYLTDKVRDAASRSLANRGFLIITRESMEELLLRGPI
jgi:hypothetical protein